MYQPNNSTNAAMAAADIFGIIRVTTLEIVIDSNVFRHFESFELEQSTSSHHSFRLVLQNDILGTVQDHLLQDARQFLGRRLSATFRYKGVSMDGPEREFIGVIMQVGFKGEFASKGSIVLTGQSPTGLLDGAPHTQSFGGNDTTNLGIIAKKVIIQGLGESRFDIDIRPAYVANFAYSCQYNETNYNYLNRMAAAYGEWFYYDGRVVHFGKPALADPLRLIYGKDTSSVELHMNAQHTDRQFYGYNSSTNSMLSSVETPVNGLGEMGMFALAAGNMVFISPSVSVAPQRVVSNNEVGIAQQTAVGSAAAEAFTLTGNTSVPFLYPGCLIEMNFRKPESGDVRYFSRLIVIAVKHTLDMRGNYQGIFTAIPSDTGYLPQHKYTLPNVHPQLATVIANGNSEGRVQVQFNWQQGLETTAFIRVATPDAGSSKAGNKNRGFVFIPEEGDQVMVNFTEGNPDRPFVQGAMFHGENGEGGGSENNIKTITTRSGHILEFYDKEGEEYIALMDGKKRNIIKFDTQKEKLYITASGDIEMEAENIHMNARNAVTINAKNNVEVISEKENIVVQAGELLSIKSINTSVTVNAKENIVLDANMLEAKTIGDTNIKADGNINIKSNGKALLKSTETNVEGAAHKLTIK